MPKFQETVKNNNQILIVYLLETCLFSFQTPLASLVIETKIRKWEDLHYWPHLYISFDLAEVLVVVNKIWQPPLAVDDVTSLTDWVGQRTGTTAEHTHFAHVAVLFLNKFQEGRHVWPPKVVDGFQASEHTPALQSLEVILADILKEKK